MMLLYGRASRGSPRVVGQPRKPIGVDFRGVFVSGPSRLASRRIGFKKQFTDYAETEILPMVTRTRHSSPDAADSRATAPYDSCPVPANAIPAPLASLRM